MTTTEKKALALGAVTVLVAKTEHIGYFPAFVQVAGATALALLALLLSSVIGCALDLKSEGTSTSIRQQPEADRLALSNGGPS